MADDGPTAPSSTVAGTDADTAWLSAAWESGADDLNLSDLNRRFPLLQLAQELADAIEKAPRSGNQSGRMAVVVPDGFHISGCPSVSDAAEGPGYRIRHHKTVPGGCHRWIFRHPAGKCAEKSRRVHLQHQPGVSGTTGNLHPRGML